MIYVLLDRAFFVGHAALAAFIVLGWMWPRVRPWHLATVLATAFSWVVLGFWYGFGYCPCTGWHWNVRMRLGWTDMPRSYLKFLFDQLTGLDANAVVVDTVATVAFVVAGLLSLGLVVRDWRRRRGPPPATGEAAE